MKLFKMYFVSAEAKIVLALERGLFFQREIMETRQCGIFLTTLCEQQYMCRERKLDERGSKDCKPKE